MSRIPRAGKVRAALLRRDGPYCYLCGREFDPGYLRIEHKVPSSRGGRNNYDNLGLACPPCDIAKGDLTAEEYLRDGPRKGTKNRRKIKRRIEEAKRLGNPPDVEYEGWHGHWQL
jgi:5-methylcytosine-specific restriction endonuclease McrA